MKKFFHVYLVVFGLPSSTIPQRRELRFLRDRFTLMWLSDSGTGGSYTVDNIKLAHRSPYIAQSLVGLVHLTMPVSDLQ